MWAMAFGAILFAIGCLFGYGMAIASFRAIIDTDYSDD